MTAYADIADSEIDPESPGTTTLFTKLRDNPIAITEKASGAPVLANDYVVTAMIADANVTTAKIADSNVTTAKITSGERMNTANVLGATAGASVNAVGSYAFLSDSGSTSINAGSTLSGASLKYTNANGTALASGPSGTWRIMGAYSNTDTSAPGRATLWLRIS